MTSGQVLATLRLKPFSYFLLMLYDLIFLILKLLFHLSYLDGRCENEAMFISSGVISQRTKVCSEKKS